ncbi:MAG: DUF3299 domain-containing protein [Deltaproteobacteria bacterium]|nr:DUF3299 domain-containing protein [Deltaproteobacteria bacterium]
MQHKPSKNFVWSGGLGLILLSTALAYLLPQKSFMDEPLPQQGFSQDASVQVLSWKLLQQYDFKKKTIPPELRDFVGQKIRLPGFAVPLGGDLNSIRDFLFVPDQLACIHVPPPPPNLVLLVHSGKGQNINDLRGALWIEGVLTLSPSTSQYGAAAWELEADQIMPYKQPPS